MKSLVRTCVALELQRAKRNGTAPQNYAASLCAEEFQQLIDDEEFQRLVDAKKAIETGYYDFLKNLRLIHWWIQKQAKSTDYADGLDKKTLQKINLEHEKGRKALDFDEEEVLNNIHGRFDEEWMLDTPLRAYADTDLPTKGFIREIHTGVFPDQWKWWDIADRQPAKNSQIWKDAELSEVKEDKMRGSHPCLAERRASLKEWLRITGIQK